MFGKAKNLRFRVATLETRIAWLTHALSGMDDKLTSAASRIGELGLENKAYRDMKVLDSAEIKRLKASAEQYREDAERYEGDVERYKARVAMCKVELYEAQAVKTSDVKMVIDAWAEDAKERAEKL